MIDLSNLPVPPLLQVARVIGEHEEQRMATARSFAPPPRPSAESLSLDQVAASLAGGMIAASGKVPTPEEAVAVWRRVREVMASK